MQKEKIEGEKERKSNGGEIHGYITESSVMGKSTQWNWSTMANN